MAIDGLTIIGESINDSVPSTHKLFDAGDLEGLDNLARTQDELGAAYIDVNVGPRPPQFMAEMVQRVQGVTAKPLSIDSPDPAMVAAALDAYDADRAGGKPPVINSISPLRLEVFDLLDKQPFVPILLVSERMEDGMAKPNHTAEQTYQTACELRSIAADRGLSNDQMIFDPAIAPIGSDTENNIHRLLGFIGRYRDRGLVFCSPRLRCSAIVALGHAFAIFTICIYIYIGHYI